jgi:hypothetical protein
MTKLDEARDALQELLKNCNHTSPIGELAKRALTALDAAQAIVKVVDNQLEHVVPLLNHEEAQDVFFVLTCVTSRAKHARKLLSGEAII